MLEYILLGILQGIFEWLPVSSEGIVALLGNLMGGEFNPVDIALFLHLGTLLAVMIYFAGDWKDVLILKQKDLLVFLIITTAVSLPIGFLLYSAVRDAAVGAGLLFIVGSGLILTSFFHRTRKSLNLGMRKLAVLAGVLQGMAVIPGLSRSGSTIFGLSMGKLKPEQILRLSYMMSAPAVLASSAYLLIREPLMIHGWPAVVSSFAAGMLALHLLMRLSQRINFFMLTLIFGILCLAGGAISIMA
ncbi:MAG: undecaprenyl-diphosphate phosphatase [Candidatus Woesearchaeota archaeon]